MDSCMFIPVYGVVDMSFTENFKRFVRVTKFHFAQAVEQIVKDSFEDAVSCVFV